ncbi:hypothetical protein HF521_016676 [Silurus meridionalis]|uniref:Peptidase A2 domain-containing protein n=1 Tax=Silurus meridionalis TaxID=175797 RepID=A0A8T0BWG2_SILME|nr:hypothetical protein HF521_016676 [Silurus meridionalis]
MSHNPTQDYSHKELAKILGLLTYNLIAQAKMDEVKVSRLQQESLSFRIQAEEAQRNLAHAHDQLDQIMAETQSQRGKADEKDAELQEEVKGLQQALIDLHVDTARREQQEKDTSEELQQAKALLIRAETELKERVARAKAYEGHLQSAREEINALRKPDLNTHDMSSQTEPPEAANFQHQTSSQNPKIPKSAVLMVCLPDEPLESSSDCLSVTTPAPGPRLLGNLLEKGMAKKLYLAITLENELRLEALVDTGADLTLMSTQLFYRLQVEAKRQNRTLKMQKCALNVQSYSQNEVKLEQITPIHLTIGPMSVVHPVYISPMDTYPLLIGKDLLDRFEPLLDFKQLKPKASKTDCQATKVMGNHTTSREGNLNREQRSRSLPCAFQLTKDSDSYCPRAMESLQLADAATTDIIIAQWADNLAISEPPGDTYRAITRTLKDLMKDKNLTFQKSSWYGDDLCPGAWDYVFSLDLLCAQLGWIWTVSHVIRKDVWLILNTWLKQTQTEETNFRNVSVAAIFRLLASQPALCISTIIGYALSLGLALLLFKKNQWSTKIHEQVHRCSSRVFNRNHRRSKTQPESTISLTKLNPMPEEPRAEGN